MAKTRERYTEHPSITVIGGKPKLRVFEDFFIEEELPKWRKIAVKIEKQDKGKSDDTSASMNGFGSSWENNGSISDRRTERELLRNARHERRNYIGRMGNRIDTNTGSALIVGGETKKKSWFGRILEKFSSPKKQKEPDKQDEIGEPADKVFEEVKASMMSPTNEELLRAKKVVDTVENQLKVSGQYEIAEKVNGSRGVLEAELALVSSGQLKYISEEQIIKFMLLSERGMRLEYLRYYSNILPSEVAKRKIVFDGLLVFDNYCVLYYDGGAPKFSLIKEVIDDQERIKRRDPILFGMIKGSRKLYYVTDWVTDDDDLTLEKLETVIGEKAHDLSHDGFAGTEEEIGRMLDRMVIDIEVESEEAAKKGILITDENMMEFITTGKATKPLRDQFQKMGIRPMDGVRVQSDGGGKRKRKRRHRH